MDAIGHIDVAAGEKGMVFVGPRLLVAQPTTTAVPIALLVGHRAADTLDSLVRAGEDLEVFIDIGEERAGYPCLPSRVKITAENTRDLEQLANAIRAEFVAVPPADRFSEFCLTVSDYLSKRPWSKQPDLNWEKRIYDPARLVFSETKVGSGLTLLEFRNPYSAARTYYLRDGDKTCQVDRDWGRYAALQSAGCHVLGYFDYAPKSQRGHLIVPVGAPLPRLYARSAALCSGHPPAFRAAKQVQMKSQEWRGFYLYTDVRRQIADRIAARLGQVLQPALVHEKGPTNV